MPVAKAERASSSDLPFPVVGIGASAGGLEAYLELFSELPPNTGMAFVLVQHLSPHHLSILGTLIQKSTKMMVREIVGGDRIEPNNVYVIPPNYALTISQGTLHLEALQAGEVTNRLIDKFFSSLAKDHRNLAIGIVLSGTGSDGAQGLREIKAEGGISLVQDPKTAKFDGMPSMAIANDHPDMVLPVRQLAQELVKIAGMPPSGFRYTQAPVLSSEDEPHLQKIFRLVQSRMGTDFTIYKAPTLLRRMNRRMVLHKIGSLKFYAAYLQSSPAELEALFNDLLINVTEFFRDPEAFEALKKKVFPTLVKGREEGSPIRIWVPGCSSGEEVYSLAIVLFEYLAAVNARFPIQIYGSDVSDLMIKKARAGSYPASIENSVSKERLSRYFVEESGRYRVKQEIRNCCVFSIQDVTTDPPIHRLDLLSCRNLLIYLEPPVQKRLMETFFYALNPTGFLFLGAAESVGAAASLFSLVDANKIFARRPQRTADPQRIHSGRSARKTIVPAAHSVALRPTKNPAALDPVAAAESYVMEKCAPAWLLVDQDFDVVHFRGNADRYLTHASGQPSWNLGKILNRDLTGPIRILIHQASGKAGVARKTNLRFKVGKIANFTDVEVASLGLAKELKHYLIVFREAPRRAIMKEHGKGGKRGARSSRLLSQELESAQTSLREIMEAQNSTNEAFQNANEEVLSANEELQSTNEELETAKEELQSTNEELTTMIQELHVRNSELSHASNDLSNILKNANVPIVMVGPDLKIRRFTPTAGKLLKLLPADIGRSFADINTGFVIAGLEAKVNEVLGRESTPDIEVPDRSGNVYSIRIRPYKTTDNQTDGAVIVFIDIAEVKEKERLALAAEKYSSAIVQTVRDPLVVMTQGLVIEKASQTFCDLFLPRKGEVIGRVIYEVPGVRWDIPELKSALDDVLSDKSKASDVRVSGDFENGGHRTFLVNAQRLEWDEKEDYLILMSFHELAQP